MQRKEYLLLCILLSATLIGCGTKTQNSDDLSSNPNQSESVNSNTSESNLNSNSTSSDSNSTSQKEYNVNEDFDFLAHYPNLEANPKKLEKLGAYTPTTFSTSTYKTQITNLSDGVDLVNVEYTITSGSRVVKPVVVEVDLTKANIVAGSYDNTTSANFSTRSHPIDMANAWVRDNPGKDFIAVTNADFFGSTVVNAFVKDGVILKNKHNEDRKDVPVSLPMLFGVSSKGAMIGSMSNSTDYVTNQDAIVQKGLIMAFKSDGTVITQNEFIQESASHDKGLNIVTQIGSQKAVRAGNRVFLFKKIQQDQTKENEVRGCIVEEVKISKIVMDASLKDYGYLVVGNRTRNTFEVGDYIFANNQMISTVDGKWNGFDTILGCRHSLVENGTVPATVAQESQNGAKTPVPRTAIGIKDDGKVVIVSIEDLHYGGKASTCTGLTLSQLADFMRYYGCYDAANFDGGGSTQLITKAKGGEATVQTRSSDNGGSGLTDTRIVMNSIIVTTK